MRAKDPRHHVAHGVAVHECTVVTDTDLPAPVPTTEAARRDRSRTGNVTSHPTPVQFGKLGFGEAGARVVRLDGRAINHRVAERLGDAPVAKAGLGLALNVVAFDLDV